MIVKTFDLFLKIYFFKEIIACFPIDNNGGGVIKQEPSGLIHFFGIN